MTVVAAGGRFRWWWWFRWLLDGWFCMCKVDIAVTGVVLDDALLSSIVVKVLKIGSFVVVDHVCPVRRQ